MSETIPYIIAENGYYYVAYKEKVKSPYIVVSSKGVANGLSEEYNDGWDFGPDSYSPTSTSAIPYTQTAGWQEAINYIISQNGGKIIVKNGIYDLTNAPVINGYKISIPYIDTNTATFIPISIEGESFGNFNNVLTMSGNNIIKDSLKGGVIIWDSSTDKETVFGVETNSNNDFSNVFVSLNNLVVFTNMNYMNGISLKYAVGCDIGLLSISVLNDLYGYTSSPADSGTAVGFITPKSYTYYPNHIKYLEVNGYQYGIIIAGGAVQAETVLLGANVNGLFIQGGLTTSKISLLLDQSNDVCVKFNNGDSAILIIDNYSFNNQYSYSALNVRISTGTGYPTFLKINNISYYITNPLSTPFDFTYGSPGSNFILILPDNSNNYGITYPSLTTPSVPASGTAQSNANPYAVKVYINGGALTEIQITIDGTVYTVYSNSTASAVYEGFTLPAGASITLTYTTAPTWSWVPE